MLDYYIINVYGYYIISVYLKMPTMLKILIVSIIYSISLFAFILNLKLMKHMKLFQQKCAAIHPNK
jgi:hypothetical protein